MFDGDGGCDGIGDGGCDGIGDGGGERIGVGTVLCRLAVV